MRERNKPFIIFSVTRPEWKDTLQEKVNNDIARQRLASQDISYKEVRGRHHGMEEEAFLVHADREKEVMVIAREFEQHSILYVDEDRYGYFICLTDDEREYVGKFAKTTKTKALEHYGYTYDPINDQYWVLTQEGGPQPCRT